MIMRKIWLQKYKNISFSSSKKVLLQNYNNILFPLPQNMDEYSYSYLFIWTDKIQRFREKKILDLEMIWDSCVPNDTF